MEVVTENQENIKGRRVSNIEQSVLFEVRDSVGWIELDLQGEKVNKLSRQVMERITEILEQVRSNQQVKALVVISKKEKIYIAGADINEIKEISTEEEFFEAVQGGQEIMNQFEDLKVPVIAAIHGACVGGGCEFALACDYRIASDDKSTKIGLPEVQLGIIPGFGGCVRLPRVVGLQESLGIILAGKSVPAKKAKKIGLIDEMIPAAIFRSRAEEYAKEIVQKGAKKRKKTFSPKGMMNKVLEGPLKSVIYSQAKKNVMKQSKGHYPAPLEALQVVKDTYGADRKRALKREAKGFVKVAMTDISKNLINLFFVMEEVKKSTGVKNPEIKPKDVDHISVLGAGTMGGGIAQLGADKGIFVRMKDITNEALAKGYEAAAAIWNKKLKRRRMTKYEFSQKMGRMSGGLDYAGFGMTDLVVEAIVENMDIKKKVIAETAKHMKEDAIFATNTSSLSVTEMSEAFPKRENFIGMHFFNPVHKMPLVEVIRCPQTSDEVTATTFALAKKMGKTPVVVQDGPGFLVNRLLLPWLSEALFILEDGMGVEEIDRMFTHKFGMPMGPYRLMDEIGLDVCMKVLKIFKDAFGDRMPVSSLVDKFSEIDRLGKKNGKGFYTYSSSGKEEGFDSGMYDDLGLPSSRNGKLSEEECINRGIFCMINEASRAFLEDGIVDSPQNLDLAMIMGTGFPPFRGGLLKYADAVGIKDIVSELEVFESKYGVRFKPAKSLVDLAGSGKGFYS